MATIKSFTSLEQSKKLAEILSLESADMIYTMTNGYHTPFIRIETIQEMDKDDVCAWSLASLLDVLPFHLIANNQRYAFSMHKGLNKDGETYMLRYNVFNTDVCLYSTDYYNNPIDACYRLILKLHELNLL